MRIIGVISKNTKKKTHNLIASLLILCLLPSFCPPPPLVQYSVSLRIDSYGRMSRVVLEWEGQTDRKKREMNEVGNMRRDS